MNTTPRFCTQCGTPIPTNARFCGQCGSPLRHASPPEANATLPPPPAPPSSLPTPQAITQATTASSAAEPILSVTPGVQRKKGFLGLGVQTYSLVITPVRLIFAYLDNRSMQAYVTRARDQAKSEGKGFFGQMGAQLSWVRLLEQELLATPPDRIVAQDPNSFVILTNAITRVRLRQSTDPEDQTRNAVQIVIQTASGKERFQLPTTMNVSRRELKDRLQQALGDRVR